jgi:hypothetical protein
MTPLRALLLPLGLALPGLASRAAEAQGVRARSADYLFITTVGDARAIWLNPAGLGVVPVASIMAELVLDRVTTGELRVSQWSAGLGSRGLSFGYKRDRIPGEDDTQTFRVALGLPFTRGALGGSFTFYDSDRTQRGLDLGVLYHPLRSVTVGGVTRHIGRPEVRGVRLPLTAVAGVAWAPVGPPLQFAGEALFVEGLDGADAEVQYRAGAMVTASIRLPVSGFAAVDLGSGLSLDRWAVGIALGGAYQGIAVASGDDLPRLERLSATGLARRVLGGRGR